MEHCYHEEEIRLNAFAILFVNHISCMDVPRTAIVKYSEPTDLRTLYVNTLISTYKNWQIESDRIYKILTDEGNTN